MCLFVGMCILSVGSHRSQWHQVTCAELQQTVRHPMSVLGPSHLSGPRRGFIYLNDGNILNLRL